MNLVRVLFVFAAVLLVFGTIRGESSVTDFFELRDSHAVLEETVKTLEQQTNDLALEITKIKNSPSYAKKVLRDKYHVTDDDEKIVFFAD